MTDNIGKKKERAVLCGLAATCFAPEENSTETGPLVTMPSATEQRTSVPASTV